MTLCHHEEQDQSHPEDNRWCLMPRFLFDQLHFIVFVIIFKKFLHKLNEMEHEIFLHFFFLSQHVDPSLSWQNDTY